MGQELGVCVTKGQYNYGPLPLSFTWEAFLVMSTGQFSIPWLSHCNVWHNRNPSLSEVNSLVQKERGKKKRENFSMGSLVLLRLRDVMSFHVTYFQILFVFFPQDLGKKLSERKLMNFLRD